LRIGLALHGLHRLANKEAKQFLLAAAILLNLVAIIGDNIVDRSFDGASIADLFQAFGFGDLARLATSLKHDLEDLLGLTAADLTGSLHLKDHCLTRRCGSGSICLITQRIDHTWRN